MTMTLNQLYEEMRAALSTNPGSSMDAATVDRLSTGAQRFASTVGWAQGVIDKDGNIASAFGGLRDLAQKRLEIPTDSRPDGSLVTLYEALSNLILAVQNHDEDLDPSADNTELEHDF